MILEGIITTRDTDGKDRISPMGPSVELPIRSMVLRPFATSNTYHNLKRTGVGVFHVTDDVELMARAAVHQLSELPRTKPARAVTGSILTDACRWYALQVSHLEDQQPRARIECDVVDQGRLRDFLGFNRAKHAVVEAAILATRVGLLPHEEVLRQFRELAVIVQKTAGRQETRAFQFLYEYVRRSERCGG
jgi:hypothetical protein